MWAEVGYEIGLTVLSCTLDVILPISLSEEMFCISEASLQYWRILAAGSNRDAQSIHPGLVEFVQSVSLVLLH